MTAAECRHLEREMKNDREKKNENTSVIPRRFIKALLFKPAAWRIF